ncbi:SNF1-related protein kinase regulatory subunit gamma-1 [Hordeum vulgare]|nr:SNF1-related protein kinase regulatory subunit gamma-1 [Hordeum vulgare]
MKTKMKDISGSFRWAPFLPLQISGTLLTMLLLSKYRMESLPVVDIGEGAISNILTRAAVMKMKDCRKGYTPFDCANIYQKCD